MINSGQIRDTGTGNGLAQTYMVFGLYFQTGFNYEGNRKSFLQVAYKCEVSLAHLMSKTDLQEKRKHFHIFV